MAKRKPAKAKRPSRKVRVEHYQGLARTPALALAVAGWDELLSSALIEEVFLINWDDRALVAFLGDQPVGVLTYRNLKDYAKQYSIGLGYVLPEHRGKNIYAHLWNDLVRRARADGIKAIEGATSMQNTAMRAQAEKSGRVERAVMLGFCP